MKLPNECTALKSIALPSTVRQIDNNAFSLCSGLGEIELPEGCESIGAHAFYRCRELKKAIIPLTVHTIDNTAFEESENLVIYSTESSWAQTYARTHAIPFKTI